MPRLLMSPAYHLLEEGISYPAGGLCNFAADCQTVYVPNAQYSQRTGRRHLGGGKCLITGSPGEKKKKETL